MAQNPLAPPPQSGGPLDGWLFLLWRRLTQAGQVLWDTIDFTGSDLTDIAARNHADLQNINTVTYTHLSATNHTDLTDAGDSALHYHAADRARANHTGTQTLATISDAGTIASQAANSVAITGGAIDGTAIGATTKAAGGFTTLTATGDVSVSKTITAGGTTGAQTINKTAGSVNFAALATSLVVTNSLVTANSVVLATVATNDATLTSIQVVAGAGTFTLYANAAATAETRVNFIVIN